MLNSQSQILSPPLSLDSPFLAPAITTDINLTLCHAFIFSSLFQKNIYSYKTKLNDSFFSVILPSSSYNFISIYPIEFFDLFYISQKNQIVHSDLYPDKSFFYSLISSYLSSFNSLSILGPK